LREQLYAFEESALLAYLDRIENASAHEIELATAMFPEPEDDDDDETCGGIYSETADGVTITIDGPLSMTGPSPIARLYGYNGTGYRQIMAACARARAQKPKAVTLQVNTPGGEVAGADQAFQAVQAMAAEIPTRAVNGGLVASAGYWIVSPTGQIVATSPACEQGSIGVVIAGIDDSKMGEKLGMRRVTIVSRRAPNKAAGLDTAHGRDVLQDRADQLEDVFLARVAEGRGKSVDTIAETFGKGALLTAREALAVGMIDAIVPAVPAGVRSQPVGAVAQTQGAGVHAIKFPADHPLARLPAAQTRTGGSTMTLAELLQANPGALTEYNAALKAATEAAKAECHATAKTVGKYLVSDVYSKSKAIVERVIKALQGEGSADSVEAAVSMFDLMAEQTKAAAAVVESASILPTPAQTQSVATPGAVVGANPATAEADLAAVIARDRAAQGLPVAVK
jgi:ClpP class serine protease